jgi:hypothetical protein
LTITLMLADVADLAFGNGKNWLGQLSFSVPAGRLAAASGKLREARPEEIKEKIWVQKSGFGGSMSLKERLGATIDNVGLVGRAFDPEKPLSDRKKEDLRQWVLKAIEQGRPNLGLPHLTQKTHEGDDVARLLASMGAMEPFERRFQDGSSGAAGDPLEGNDHWALLGQTALGSPKKWDLAEVADPIFQALRACGAAPDAYWGPYWMQLRPSEMANVWMAPSRWQALSCQWLAAPRF